LRAADLRPPQNLNFFNPRTAQKEGPLYPDAMAGDTADGKIGFVPAFSRSDYNTLKYLHAFARAFNDPHMHLDRVARFDFRMFVIVDDQGLHKFLAHGCLPSTKIRPKALAIILDEAF
jgi:hypothetical protein